MKIHHVRVVEHVGYIMEVLQSLMSCIMCGLINQDTEDVSNHVRARESLFARSCRIQMSFANRAVQVKLYRVKSQQVAEVKTKAAVAESDTR